MKCNTCGSENIEGAHFCASCGATLAAGEKRASGLVGQVVGGRYHVKRVLGEGGMGIVYEAEQPMGTATRKVALKTLHSHLSQDPSVSQRFHREVGTIAQLEHPNTIKVYDFGATSDGTLYIAMEFVAGKSLSQLLEESKVIAPDRVLRIVKQIAGSLEEAHQQGVIHRDLKPDNVVLTQRAGEKDVVKLLDFGIAARTESADAQREQKLTQQGMVLGTPPYMSPEQFTGKALDARSDVYSLGVMTYEMVTGRLPFEANTPWQWATEHMMSQPIPFEATPLASQIPASMRAAILRALAKNKEERQTSVTQFYEELAGAAAPQEAGTGAAAAGAPARGTAAMAAPPVFDAPAAPLKTAAMPAPVASGPSTAQAVATAIPHVPERRGGGGNKGLVIGLVSVGGVLLLGMLIVAMRNNKVEDQPPSAPATSPPPATVKPTVEPAQPTAEATSEPVAPATAAPQTSPRPTGQTTKPPSGTEPAHTSGGSTTPKPPATTPPPSGNPCAACVSAAQAGNFSSAASAYNSCTDPGVKAQCSGIVKSKAGSAVQTEAFNGNCAKAKAMAAAAQSMGAPGGAFAKALAACK